MIIISNPTPIENEIKIIHSLFAEGLELFHVRKPDFSSAEIKLFLTKIGIEFRHKLILHQHHHLAEDFGINRIHFTEKRRKEMSKEQLYHWKEKGFHLSTSVHSIEDFNALDIVFDYAFLGPVFDSISKQNYNSVIDFKLEIQHRINNAVRLVALGGITANKIKTALEYGFDDAALLGTIWNSNMPIKNFKLCQQIAHSYSL